MKKQNTVYVVIVFFEIRNKNENIPGEIDDKN